MNIRGTRKLTHSWKRILLITPNSLKVGLNFYQTRFDAPPLNLAYIASYLTDLNVEVEIIDAKVNRLSDKQLKRKIKKFKPDIVGISVTFTTVVNICYDIAKIVKEIDHKCIVVFGGQHPTAVPDDTLKVNEVDIVVRGEGELTFRELIKKGTPENVKGISYKSNGLIIHNPDRDLIKDLGTLRLPARHLIKKNKYKMFSVRFDTLETSRGCPHRCKFCYTPVFNKGLWRTRPVENIITELKVISQNRKISDIFIIDDNLTANPHRIEKLSERIIECKKKKEINDFFFTAQMRVDAIVKSPQMIKKMAEAGLCAVFIGIESPKKKVLDEIGKKISFNMALKAIEILHKYNIIIASNMIIGFDLYATEEDIKEEIKFMKKVDVDELSFNLLGPFPGTPILKEFQEKNLIVTKDWSKYTYHNPVFETYQLNQKKLRELLIYAYKEISYLNNGIRKIQRLLKLRGWLFVLNLSRIYLLVQSAIKRKILLNNYSKELN
ncbi:MAG: B12-binding domain-containing radical SAM protein [Candidatus Hermodarchaeota archaeon]